jgi:5-methylcytosine-specific restriction endonuclease McrA
MSYNKHKTYFIEGEWGGKVCIKCGWFRNWWEFNINKKGFKGYQNRCRECTKKYYVEKREDIHKKYYLDHREDKLKYQKEYNLDKKEYQKEYKESPALFNIYSNQLTIEEQPRETVEGFLEVKCANSECREYFIPTNQQIQSRIQALKGQINGESRLYCSEKCKHECSLYRQRKYPKGFKTKPNGTEFPAFVRDEIFKRDNYKCQICGGTHRLQAHHIYPGSTHPMLSNDVDNGITLCKKCHKKVHKLPGCGLQELASCSQRIKQDLDDKGIDPHEIPDWAVEKYMETNNNIQESLK